MSGSNLGNFGRRDRVFEGCMQPWVALVQCIGEFFGPLGSCDNPIGFGDFDQNGLVNISDLATMLVGIHGA